MNNITIGSVVDGRYKVVSLIGTGGMAHVYKGIDKLTGQSVAIKVLKQEYTQDGEFLRRFRSEAQAVLNLSHENIVRSKDLGTLDGDNYIVLEYIEGKTLKEAIKARAPFNNDTIIRIGAKLCDGLAHAHDCNIIHRDVKPQNVLMSQSGAVKLADFGIARFVDATTQTYQGASVLGSVHYISPEQARGESVDPKGDIYSLGIVLYEMATGSVPFDSENTVSIAIKHIQEQIVPPIERNPNLSIALNSIILKATQKDKALRYETMRDMKRDLIRAMRKPDIAVADEGKPIRVRAEHTKAVKTLPQMQVILSVGVLVVVLIGILLAVFFIVKALSENSSEKELIYVPSLTNKTEIEAEKTATRLGFKFFVRSRVTNEAVQEGLVFEQTPKSGNKANRGDGIYVDISAGAPVIEMPVLEGQTLEQAEYMVNERGLLMDNIMMEYSDFADGTVLRQVPEAGTYVEVGEYVELWVSGDTTQREAVPAMVNTTVSQAANLVKASGFETLLVHKADKDSTGEADVIVNQLPTAGEYSALNVPLEVWAIENTQMLYSGDYAVNINVKENDSAVSIIMVGTVVQKVLFEQILPAGTQTISLTISSDNDLEKTIVTYINGVAEYTDKVQVSKK